MIIGTIATVNAFLWKYRFWLYVVFAVPVNRMGALAAAALLTVALGSGARIMDGEMFTVARPPASAVTLLVTVKSRNRPVLWRVWGLTA